MLNKVVTEERLSLAIFAPLQTQITFWSGREREKAANRQHLRKKWNQRAKTGGVANQAKRFAARRHAHVRQKATFCIFQCGREVKRRNLLSFSLWWLCLDFYSFRMHAPHVSSIISWHSRERERERERERFSSLLLFISIGSECECLFFFVLYASRGAFPSLGFCSRFSLSRALRHAFHQPPFSRHDFQPRRQWRFTDFWCWWFFCALERVRGKSMQTRLSHTSPAVDSRALKRFVSTSGERARLHAKVSPPFRIKGLDFLASPWNERREAKCTLLVLSRCELLNENFLPPGM